jgi:prepilin-type N-terminal cleavage/methylation domain-containing protein
MKEKRKNSGFSLTEVLIAVGILSVGLLFIAGTFSAGIRFTTVAYERTVASVAAKEAFAKIRLFRPLVLTANQQTLLFDPNIIDPNIINNVINEFSYPSIGDDWRQKRYFWSALGRQVDESSVQVTVFVSRKTGPNLTYHASVPSGMVGWPMPVMVGVTGTAGDYLLTIQEAGKTNWINDGYTIVDDETGQIYRVLERYASDEQIILLDGEWQGSSSGSVWVVPPPVGAGRYPCIAVYQKVIRF